VAHKKGENLYLQSSFFSNDIKVQKKAPESVYMRVSQLKTLKINTQLYYSI